MIRRTFSTLLLAAGIAAAQQGATEDALRKQVAEISRLMRESERLLLEITRVDRLVETQKQVEEELKKLLPPEQPGQQGGAGADEQAKQRQQLEAKHLEISERLEKMLTGEREKAALTVQQLEELLKNLPRQQQANPSGGGSGEPQPSEQEKRLRERDEEERKQHQPQTPRKQPDHPRDKQQQAERKPPSPTDPTSALRHRVDAWIAHLPAEDVERINRNDYSRVPERYRKLVEELTAERAKREADKEPDTDR